MLQCVDIIMKMIQFFPILSRINAIMVPETSAGEHSTVVTPLR